MRKVFVITAISFVTVLCFAASGFADDFFAVEDAYPKLTGVGKTVIEATRIDEFAVEVIDVIPEGGFDSGPMILIKVSGPTVDFSKGIAAGYSGSPVYFNGKLAGAISSAIPGTDTHICGVTPIRSMLKALDQGEAVDTSKNTVLPSALTQFSTGPGGPVIPIDEETPEDQPGDEGNGEEEKTPPTVAYTTDWEMAARENAKSLVPAAPIYAVPLTGRLLVGGVSTRTFDRLKPVIESCQKFGGYTFAAGPSGAGPKGFGLLKDKSDASTLHPGDALAIALVTGDYELAAIGTVTYIDGQNRILALGHSMFNDGLINIPFGKAYISYTYSALDRGFKDGYMLNALGTLTNDHAAAVGGLVGLDADMVDVRINLNDVDRSLKKTYTYKLIRDEDIFENLLYFVTLLSYYEFLDRIGGGTIHIGYMIEGAGMKKPFERDNYFYDKFDAISFIAAEALPTAALVLFNNYREIKIDTFTVNVDVTNNRVNASIDKAEIVDNDKTEENGEAAAEQSSEVAAEQSNGGEGNGEEESEASNVQVEPDVVPPDITAAGEEAPQLDLEVREFTPGEIVRVKVTLQPYRQPAFEQELMIRIPRDFPEGQTSLIVQGGGGLVSYFNEYGGKGTMLFPIMAGPLPLGPEILEIDETLDKIRSGEKNNQLMILIPRPPTPEQQQAEASGIPPEEVWSDDEKEVKVTIPMDYVIYDMYMLPINIVKQKSK
jgi:hypothetical protein